MLCFAFSYSLGGGLANLFSYKAAQLKAKGDERVKYLPEKITALTFAAPVVGNKDFNKEYQYLEKKGNLRHIRVSNNGDVVPTNNIIPPFSIFPIRGSSRVYTQNGVNLFLLPEDEAEVDYRATKTMFSQLCFPPLPTCLTNHLMPEYYKRVELEVNKKVYEKTVEELYAEAGDFTN